MTLKPAVVIFVGDPARMARFYAGLTGLVQTHADADHTVLESAQLQLVLHAIRGNPDPVVGEPAAEIRVDACIKPCLPVSSLDLVRARVEELGGRLKGPDAEWQGRGFRACDGVDPEGNVVQFRAPVNPDPP